VPQGENLHDLRIVIHGVVEVISDATQIESPKLRHAPAMFKIE
jgi:hypothetical protein